MAETRQQVLLNIQVLDRKVELNLQLGLDAESGVEMSPEDVLEEV